MNNVNHWLVRLLGYIFLGACTTTYVGLTGYEESDVLEWRWYKWVTIIFLPVAINAVKDLFSFMDHSFQKDPKAGLPTAP